MNKANPATDPATDLLSFRNLTGLKKNLTGLITIVLCLITIKSNCQTTDYVQQYTKECMAAKNFYVQHQALFEMAAQNSGLSSQFLFAIIAPELTQYSYLSNKLETYSLKVLYVQNGSSYSDFSIGYFQMKPSFIELLETAAAADSTLKIKYAACLFANPNDRAARVARVDRLNTTEWQIRYLSLFCDIMRLRFDAVSFATDEERLRFYASAYNCGFLKSAQRIKEIEQQALFPHFSTKKYRYSDIAAWFYQQL